MEDIKNKLSVLNDVVNKINILCDGEIISNENFAKKYIEFFCKNLSKDEHNKIITLHTGSIIFDAIQVVLIVLYLLIMDDSTVEDIADILLEGEVYTHREERVKYIGYEKNERLYKFLKENKNILLIPIKGLASIAPYNGNAKELGKRGSVIKNLRSEFLKDVVGKKEEETTSVGALSMVLLMDRIYFEGLIDKIEIEYENKRYKLLELVRVSYFSSIESEYSYAGNANKVEANIKVASKMSVARELIFEKTDNHIIGFSAFGINGFKNAIEEFEEAMKRKKLSFSTASYNMAEDENGVFGLLESESLIDSAVFPCTKDFLLSYYTGIEASTKEIINLDTSCNSIIDKGIDCKIVESEYKWDNTKKIYHLLNRLNKEYGEESNAKQFIIHSYVLLKTMLSAIVPLKEYTNEEGIEFITPSMRIQKIKELVNVVPKDIYEACNEVCSYIIEIYNSLYESNPKYYAIREKLHSGKKTLIIVEREYLKPIIKKHLYKGGVANYCEILKENKGNSGQYDEIIVTGKLNNYQLLNWNNTRDMTFVLYDAEYWLYQNFKKKYEEKMHLLNSVSYEPVDEDTLFSATTHDENTTGYTDAIELDSIEETFVIQNAILLKNSFSYEGNVATVDVAKIAACESGEIIYFSKFYKACLLDLDNKQVKEVEIKDVKEGDSLIFTINNGQTKDIAEVIMERYIESNKNITLKDAYEDVKTWKERLIQLYRDNQYTYVDLSRLFKHAGYNVTPQTIRTWLEPDCHVVGPIKEDAYLAMDKVFKMNGTMVDFVFDPDRCFKSTALVRKQRTGILDLIGRVIIANYAGTKIKLDDSFEGLNMEDIVSLSVVMQINSIYEVKEEITIPSSKANRPIMA